MSSYHWCSMLYCTKWLHSLKTRLHLLSNDCSASPDFTSSCLVGQYWCQKLSAMCLCIFTRRRHLKKNNNRALQCARWLSMLKPVDAILTHAYIPSPTGVKCVNPTAMRSRLHYRNWYVLPAFGCAAHKWRQTGRGIPTVTSRHYGKRAIFVSGDVRFQDGDAVDLGKLSGTAFSRLLLSFNVCTLRVGMLLSCTRIGLPCYYGTAACATFAYFLCTMHVVNMRGI